MGRDTSHAKALRLKVTLVVPRRAQEAQDQHMFWSPVFCLQAFVVAAAATPSEGYRSSHGGSWIDG